MKIYRRHYCTRQHRTDKTLARCIWPKAEWIAGDGPYASVAYCRVLTVELHATADAAREALRIIDGHACGGRCYGRHELIRIERGAA